MAYLQDAVKEFIAVLSEGNDEKTVATFRSKVLESFRNGIDAGKKPSAKKRSASSKQVVQ